MNTVPGIYSSLHAVAERPTITPEIFLAPGDQVYVVTPKQLVEACNAHTGLVEALKKAQEDINWMINSEKMLNRHVFSYIDAALAAAGVK